MKKDNKNDQKINFGGATISKCESNKIGLALAIGMLGALLIYFIFGIQNKIAVLALSFAITAFGYFGVANKVFKKQT